MKRLILLFLMGMIATPMLVCAQTPPAHQHVPGMVHTPGMEHEAPQATEPGQAAFAAITEVVKILEADSATDWSKVDLEALRQHLIVMDDLTMRALVRARAIAGGLEMTVTGAGRVADAIQRMVTAHAPLMEQAGPWRAVATPVDGGVRWSVTAREASDLAIQTRIRGLGFIGLMVQGAHHTEHHLLIAKGAGDAAHRH
ncbi:MAG TPA: hypothetical protein VMK53_10030 [Gemmatimonadales bacterium]|nr:hypothetical protein [Gemmatimonadales bacterium]